MYVCHKEDVPIGTYIKIRKILLFANDIGSWLGFMSLGIANTLAYGLKPSISSKSCPRRWWVGSAEIINMGGREPQEMNSKWWSCCDELDSSANSWYTNLPPIRELSSAWKIGAPSQFLNFKPHGSSNLNYLYDRWCQFLQKSISFHLLRSVSSSLIY